jgi:hypothetical protein
MKRNVSTFILVFTVVSVCISSNLVEANFFPPIPPKVNVYIRSDGAVSSSIVGIQRDGDVYVFTKSLNRHILFVECDNIVIDGAGFSLKTDDVLDELFLVNCTNVTIKNMDVGGVSINGSSNIVVTQNTVEAVTLSSSCSNQITGNNITGSGYTTAVYVQSGSLYNVISGNRITDLEGVKTQNSNYTTISENSFMYCVSTIIVCDCYNNISKNTKKNAVSGSGGITITTAGSYNNVFANNLTGNSHSGIRIVEGHDNIICANNITSFQTGLSLGSSGRSVSGNVFYFNNFVNNVNYLEANGDVTDSNRFACDYKGNYWSRYTGIDNNFDGIGDTPYVISENFTDYYPLKNPYGSSTDFTHQITVLYPENSTYITGNIPLEFTSNKTLTWTAYRLDNKNYVEINQNTANITVTGLSGGAHNLTVFAKDSAGNVFASKTVYFTVENEFPVFNVVCIVFLIGVCVTTVFCILKIQKRKTKTGDAIE